MGLPTSGSHVLSHSTAGTTRTRCHHSNLQHAQAPALHALRASWRLCSPAGGLQAGMGGGTVRALPPRYAPPSACHACRDGRHWAAPGHSPPPRTRRRAGRRGQRAAGRAWRVYAYSLTTASPTRRIFLVNGLPICTYLLLRAPAVYLFSGHIPPDITFLRADGRMGATHCYRSTAFARLTSAALLSYAASLLPTPASLYLSCHATDSISTFKRAA